MNWLDEGPGTVRGVFHEHGVECGIYTSDSNASSVSLFIRSCHWAPCESGSITPRHRQAEVLLQALPSQAASLEYLPQSHPSPFLVPGTGQGKVLSGLGTLHLDLVLCGSWSQEAHPPNISYVPPQWWGASLGRAMWVGHSEPRQTCMGPWACFCPSTYYPTLLHLCLTKMPKQLLELSWVLWSDSRSRGATQKAQDFFHRIA